MRIALCAVVVLLGTAGLGHAQNSNDSNISPRWKKFEVPTIDPNAGYTANVGANQSQIWQSPDPSSANQSRRSWTNEDRAFGLTISRPLY